MEPGGSGLIPGITGLPITGFAAIGFAATGLGAMTGFAIGLGLKIAISDHPSASFATLGNTITTTGCGHTAFFHAERLGGFNHFLRLRTGRSYLHQRGRIA
jgi:hypothetical protein